MKKRNAAAAKFPDCPYFRKQKRAKGQSWRSTDQSATLNAVRRGSVAEHSVDTKPTSPTSLRNQSNTSARITPTFCVPGIKYGAISLQSAFYTQWLMRLFGYDALLPALVLILPAVLKIIFTNAAWVEFCAIVFPIVAYLFRTAVGLQMIEHNACKSIMRTLQKWSLFIGLFALLIVDAIMILAVTLPGDGFTWYDYLIALGVYSTYLIFMTISTYPGRNC